ncbi:MAG: YggT family protein [Sphaerobacteraceae bacterium]|nr:MAG: YggT family protein [Sphaerobacteraceae bacterium]
MEFILNVLLMFLLIMQFAIVGRAILSWFDRSQSNPVSQFLIQLTEPIVAPIRAILPSMGMIDLSPLVAILVLLVLRTMLMAALM